MTTDKTGSSCHKYFHFSMPPTHQCSVPHYRVISTRETWFLVTSHAQTGRICGVNQSRYTLPCSRCLPGYLFDGRTRCVAYLSFGSVGQPAPNLLCMVLIMLPGIVRNDA